MTWKEFWEYALWVDTFALIFVVGYAAGRYFG